MPAKYIRFFIITFILMTASGARADFLLNWHMVGQAEQNNIAITYRDKNHIIISTPTGLKLLKLGNEIYLLQAYRGFKVAVRLSKKISARYQNAALKKLPQNESNFLPIVINSGSKQTIKGYEGHILLLKDFEQTVTVVSSQDKQHIDIKNALLPMLIKLAERLPNLPNRHLIELLKLREFGLPLRVDGKIILTKSETIVAQHDAYSLKGYKVMSGLDQFTF